MGKEGADLAVDNLVPTEEEMEIIRQIECGYEPVVQLSKFTQVSYVMIFDLLFMIRLICHDMSQPKVEVFNNTLLFPDVNNRRDLELGYEPQIKHDVTGTMKRSPSTPLSTVNHPTNPQCTTDNQ